MADTWIRKERNSDASEAPAFYAYEKRPPGNWTLTYTYTGLYKKVDMSACSGVSIPDFHRRKRNGELLPMTPWAQTFISGSSTGSYSIQKTDNSLYGKIEPSGGANFFNDWVITYGQLDALLPANPDRFVQDAAAKIYSNGFDALTFLAELTDVHELFISAGKKFLKLKYPRNWRQMSSEYLSLRYGWRPLIMDIQSIAKLIDTFHEKKKRYSERCGTQYVSNNSSERTLWNGQFMWHIVTTNKITTKVRGSVVADITIPKLQFNPIVTAWELVPFSFVLDWFLSVGRALLAISCVHAAEQTTSAYGYQLEVQRSMYTYTDQWYSTWTGTAVQTASCNAVRQVRTPCPIPLLPHFKLRLDNMKILDLLALLVQHIRRK